MEEIRVCGLLVANLFFIGCLCCCFVHRVDSFLLSYFSATAFFVMRYIILFGYLNPVGKCVGTGPIVDVYDSLIGLRGDAGKEHHGQTIPEVNSPIDTSPISVAPPVGMSFFSFIVCEIL